MTAASPEEVDNFGVEERFDRLGSLRWAEFDPFLKSGVPAPALVYPELPARARVALLRDRPLFEFADDVGEEDAVPAFIFLARNEFGYALDLVAWAPGVERVAAWCGRACLLGLENFWAPRLDVDGLRVLPTPLEWLRADRKGVVILDAKRARWDLTGERLVVGDVEFGQRLRRTLRLPDPRIYVDEIQKAAA
jgi:hypothetical protein